MTRALWTLLALSAALALGACGDDAQEIVCEGKIVEGDDGRLRCVFDGPAPQPDVTSTPDVAIAPDLPPDPGPAVEDVAEEDTGPDPEWQCSSPAWKTIGAACEKHCECETGYCYDEAYLGDFRFCTKDCADGCNEGSGEFQEFACLTLGGALEGKYDLQHTSICQRRCSDVSDCKDLATAYDACGTPCPSSAKTCWEGHTVQLAPTCQITAEVQ